MERFIDDYMRISEKGATMVQPFAEVLLTLVIVLGVAVAAFIMLPFYAIGYFIGGER